MYSWTLIPFTAIVSVKRRVYMHHQWCQHRSPKSGTITQQKHVIRLSRRHMSGACIVRLTRIHALAVVDEILGVRRILRLMLCYAMDSD